MGLKIVKTIRQPFLIWGLFFCLVFISGSVSAQETEEEIPPGMEKIHIGQTEVVVPKDSKMRKEGGLVVLENTSEYVARRLYAFDIRLTELEARQEKLSKEVENLKKFIEQMQKIPLVPEEKEE